MDHTTGSGHYIYVESEPTVKIPHIAILVSTNFTFDGENCLSLWYYRSDNSDKADLFVFQYYENHSKEEVTLFHQHESAFQGWRRAQTDITQTAGYWIEMYAMLNTFGVTVGVDDITVVNGTCPKDTTTPNIKTESDEFSLFGLDKSTLLLYVFLSASSCAVIAVVIWIVMKRFVSAEKRRRAKTTRTLNTKKTQPALLELDTNEREHEHVINDENASPYSYISLDTDNTPRDDNYSTVAIDETTKRSVHSRKKPQLTTIVNNTYGRVQDIITGTVEKNMGEDSSNKEHYTGKSNQQNDPSGKLEESWYDQICDIRPDTSTDEDFQPVDDYLSLKHHKTNENKTSNESVSVTNKSSQAPGFYESFGERKPAEYLEVHLDASGKCCILEKEGDKDKATEDDKEETEECHDYYILETH